MAITTQDQALAGMLPPSSYYKASATTEGAGTFHSLFLVAGTPGAGATPPAFTAGSGYTCDRTTQGAIPFTNPVSGNSHLARFAAAAATIGTLILYDRLWTCSGFNTTTLTAQNVTTPGSLPARDAKGLTDGVGVELWLEVYTAPGATGATWTVSYTNQDGTAGRTATYTHPANAESVGQMMPMTLQAGDTGVRSVQSLTCSASSGTAGSIGITLLRRVAEIPITLVNIAQVLDFMATGFVRLYDGTCLALMVLCSATNSGIQMGSITISQG